MAKTLPFYQDSKGRYICPTCLKIYRFKSDELGYNVFFTIQNLKVGEIHAFTDIPVDKWKYWSNKILCTTYYIKRKWGKCFKTMESHGDCAVVVQRLEKKVRQNYFGGRKRATKVKKQMRRLREEKKDGDK